MKSLLSLASADRDMAADGTREGDLRAGYAGCWAWCMAGHMRVTASSIISPILYKLPPPHRPHRCRFSPIGLQII